MPEKIFDLVVIGGGINGTGIAADASARGLSVLLAETEDLAGATSSASSKLIHGGLRYLEFFDFPLVREALAEREVLLANAPHIVHPVRFVLPHVAGMRSRTTLRAGLFLYDHLAPRKALGRSRSIDLRRDPAGAPLAANLRHAFSYWDCQVDDVRLVVLNAMAARQAGAEVLTRTPVLGAGVEDGLWVVRLGLGERRVRARAVVNAAGPWVHDVAKLVVGPQEHTVLPHARLVRGSHIVVPRIGGADDAYAFQNTDGRVVFALPFEDDFTLIGTTERTQVGDARAVRATEDEEAYLLQAANRYFRVPLSGGDIVWTFAGVRPLIDEAGENLSAVSRDYKLEMSTGATPPVLHVIGGKITTYRRLAESALKLLHPYFPEMRPSTTASTPLPGGDFGEQAFESWLEDFARRNGGFSAPFLRRLARRYGTRAQQIIAGVKSEAGLGQDFGAGLTARELDYLKAEEWAVTAEDVLWRRTKTGLHLSTSQRAHACEAVQAYFDKA
jgi:glycerol-3-phosphate dehydrogenase